MKNHIIYTDGGSRGNPGLGAWAWSEFESMKPVQHGCGYKELTTNNEMELTAILEALTTIRGVRKGDTIEIRSDSSYCINIFTSWLSGWKSNGSIEWRPNKELILKIDDYIQSYKLNDINITWTKVKGHSGEPGNEYVDRLLNDAMDRFNMMSMITEVDSSSVETIELTHFNDVKLEGDYIQLIKDEYPNKKVLEFPIQPLIEILKVKLGSAE